MAASSLEERIATVEAELEQLKAKLAAATSDEKCPGWERILGTFADSEGFEEAVLIGREYRETQRPADEMEHL